MATDNRTGEPSLPTSRRGYDREATDRLLAELRTAAGRLMGERDAARAERDGACAERDDARAERDQVRAECELAQAGLAEARALVAELEQRLGDGREREKEIADALVVASRVRAESERQAADIVRAAEAEAEQIVGNARLEIRRYEQEAHNAEQLAVEARARLTAFLESLLAEIERRGTEDVSAVDVLLARAGSAARKERGGMPAPEVLTPAQPEADLDHVD